MEKMFETASRSKLRLPYKGQISVEDLWDLSVQDLDSVFKTLNSHKKQAEEESLLGTKSNEDKILELKIEIVKYIVQVKLNEENARLKAKENKEQKQKLYSILATKQETELQNKSVEEIQKMIDELEG